MRIRSGEQYREGLLELDTRVFVDGERIDSPPTHRIIAPIVNSLAATFDASSFGISDELAFVKEGNEKINRHNHVFSCKEDALGRALLQRELTLNTGACTHRCIGIDAINALDIVTRKAQKATGKPYHDRFTQFLDEAKQQDLALAASMTDPKGDRSLRPSEQADPDTFLHVSGRNADGIFVSGAKAHQGRPMAVDYTFVLPSTGFKPGEEGYAIAFVIRPDAPGIMHIMGQSTTDALRILGDEFDVGNERFGNHPAALVIFDNVFIPWEHVFLDGETEFSGMLVELFANYHRAVNGACKAGFCSLLAGIASQISEYNGVAKSSHIKDKIIRILELGETAFMGSVAAATMGCSTEDGNYIPDALMANVTKLNASRAVSESMGLLGEIAGALVVTAPSSKSLRSEATGPWLRKYLIGSEGCACEDRLRAFKLAENLLMGNQTLVAINGGGPPQVQRMGIMPLADMDKYRKIARGLAGIRG